ncbi:MAG: PVC-type heme-binding CxxCH protein [Gemmataceae bacterium]
MKTASSLGTLSFCVLVFASTFGVQSSVTLPEAQHSDKKPKGGGLTPQEALKKFVVPKDLQLELVLSEPTVKQPVFFHFDERGRMWVVQYLQYPNPAGLKLVSRDKYWRNVYDKVPPPPPNHFRGKDKITIHEDTDGDGKFDKHKTFLEGLNIVTAIARGRGGVWVLNPPYLLFYADRNNDDIPDGDPEVRLKGFGLEDTHSVVNSLRWGLDGWLYAAQGSTVSAAVQDPKSKAAPIHSMGQLIWRYHPESRKYEIFAEGGGNAFGVEIDREGRTFSGHNGGNTRGFHYVQGGYYRKGFSKHGPISNPFSYGYFPAMKHPRVPRFTHTFEIYDSGALPSRYQGKMFAVAPILSHVVVSDVLRDGSSFRTRDLFKAVDTSDRWFRPVDIKSGPDGAVYMADWYDGQISHYRNHEGQIDPSNGRIYRLKAKNAKPQKAPNLAKLSSRELVAKLGDKNRWVRRTALRLLGDRRDESLIPDLKKKVLAEKGQLSLECFWALNLCGGFNEGVAETTLRHENPHVRLWTVRLLGDKRNVSKSIANRLARMAQTETNSEVRSQLACSGRRLSVGDALPIWRNLVDHDEDVGDIHLPLLLWWLLEEHADEHRAEVLGLFSESVLWSVPMVEKHITTRLMRRYAQSGTRRDLLTCAKLLRLAPRKQDAQALLRGFEKAHAGRSLAKLPVELVRAMAARGGGSLSLRLRLGEKKALREALRLLEGDKGNSKTREGLIQILGEIRERKALPALLNLFERSKVVSIRIASLGALQVFEDQGIAKTIIAQHDRLSDDLRNVAQSVLLTRKPWTVAFVEAVDAGRVKKANVPLAVVRKMTVHDDKRLARLVEKNWGRVQGATTAAMQQKIAYLKRVIDQKAGSPYPGKKLFLANCAKCHTLFAKGGNIGPDLTTYKRDDLTNMLLHIVNPSAEIREGFETYLVGTKDGRLLSGFLVDQDNKIVVLRTAEGQDVTVERSRVARMRAVSQSLMPEGLLDPYTDQQVRDLFAYLRSAQPLND